MCPRKINGLEDFGKLNKWQMDRRAPCLWDGINNNGQTKIDVHLNIKTACFVC